MSTEQDDYDLALKQVKDQERSEFLANRAAELPIAKGKVVALLSVVRDASLQNATETEKWLFEQAIKAVKGAR